MKRGKIAIIGAGSVGSTTAYTLSVQKIAHEIVLIDTDEKRCRGETLDLSDIRGYFPGTTIRSATTITDANNADIIIIAAGKRQEKDQTRSELFEQNKKIIHSICASLSSIQKHAIVVMVTNPVDPLTTMAQQLLPLEKNQIFGSGTILDSLRLKKHIGDLLAVSPQSVSGVVLGEHGDTQFVQWSSVHINGTPLSCLHTINQNKKQEIAEKTKQEVYEIISCKGATFFGVATCISIICKAVLYNEHVALPLSCFLETEKICMSMPVILAASGITQYLPLSFNEEEDKQFQKSVHFLKQYKW